MRISASLASSLLLLAAETAQAASSWGFEKGVATVASKKGPGSAPKKFGPKSPLSEPVTLGSSETVKISLAASENGEARRPHQAFVVLREAESGLEAPFPLTVRDSGEGSVQISQRDLPVQFLLATKPLQASVILASFGSSEGLNTPVLEIQVQPETDTPSAAYEKPLRYGKLPEIHHVFRADPQSPPKVVSLFFALAVAGTVPALFISWLFLGANLSHAVKAAKEAPLAHVAFVGSVVAMEVVFFLYYSSLNLFQTLPLMGVVGLVAALSGPRALGEVQNRRLAGER